MAEKNPKREYHVGGHIIVSLSVGRIVEATIKAIVERTDGLHLQVDDEKDQTALVSERQVVREQT